MKTLMLVVMMLLSVVLVGCTTTQQGAGVGTLIGAGAGAIIGNQSGHAAEGALIGAAAGAAGGALVGDASAVKYCPVCGEEYTSGVQYCTADGAVLRFKGQVDANLKQDNNNTNVPQEVVPQPKIETEEITATQVKGLVCPTCNRIFSSGKYCNYDGSKLEVK